MAHRLTWPDDLGEFRVAVREWCREHVPAQWRRHQTGVPEAEFVRFQREWFQRLRGAGLAVPHWPREWGGGMRVVHQVVLHQELAARDAPRLVLAFVAIHHAASTLLVAGSDAQRRRHLPAILDGEIWVQGFSEPEPEAEAEAGSDLAALRTTARELPRERPEAVGERRAEERVEAGVAASMAKSYVCAAAVDVVGDAMQLHGGMGYTWESGIHVYFKRATLNRSLFGSPAAHRRRLAGRYLWRSIARSPNKR
jgi:alkylation response protein AidB-like acyl-CoA dehydrogenase